MKSKTLYIISGVPGSGKDYFLNKYFGNSSNVKIISRDVIRFSLIENNDEYFSKESLVFSKFCKAIREAFDEYDIVIGAMADDQIYNFVSDYIDGVITREQFWVLAKFKYPTHQIAFCTENALKCLEYRDCEVL